MINNTPPSHIRIATRNSPLALYQANYVKQQLAAHYPAMRVDIVGLQTEGDRLLSASLATIGGKGLFVKELEQALLDGRADIAVHSVKDLPAVITSDLMLAAVCEREDPRDVWVSNEYTTLAKLPANAVVGTASSRRSSLLRALRDDVEIKTLRGNVGTRLRKLDESQYDGIILAAAGLQRLDLATRIREYLPIEHWTPAVGQGAIGIECHADQPAIIDCLAALNHQPTQTCIRAERAMNQALNGGCQLPIAGYATLEDGQLRLRGFVGHPQNNHSIRAELPGSHDAPEQLGQAVAELLLQQGAADLLPP